MMNQNELVCFLKSEFYMNISLTWYAFIFQFQIRDVNRTEDTSLYELKVDSLTQHSQKGHCKLSLSNKLSISMLSCMQRN